MKRFHWYFYVGLGLFQSPPCLYLQRTLMFFCPMQPHGFEDKCFHWTQISFLLLRIWLGRAFREWALDTTILSPPLPMSACAYWIGSFNKAGGSSALSPCFLCILKLVKSLTVCTKVARESRTKPTRADNLKPRGRWECEQNCAWADMQNIC